MSGTIAELDDRALIAAEEAVIGRLLPELRRLQERDAEEDGRLRALHREAHQAWTEARGDRVQHEALKEALDEAAQRVQVHQGRTARQIPIGTPYFGRMVLDEEKRAAQEVLLGKVGLIEGPVRIVDWRHAPVSRLYYEYDEGDEYCEEIQGREREGVLAIKRRVDIRDGRLEELQAGARVLRRGRDGAYAPPGSRREKEGDDHRLPDIVSLITRDQFSVIARPEAGVVLLRGCAGSGKTTVALHRVAWLHFQDPARFAPQKVLVVMFNKALQTYISKVLPELGVKGVAVETFHGWAGRVLARGGVSARLRACPSAAVARVKKHPAMEALLAAHVARLGDQAAAWLREKAGQMGIAVEMARGGVPGWASARLLRQAHRGALGGHWGRLKDRLFDHVRDLYSLFDYQSPEEESRLRALLPPELQRNLPALRDHQQACAREGVMDFEDAALLLRLGQLKHGAEPELSCPWSGSLAHCVVDEAQDLSTVEIAALIDAVDAGRSVTIAGDPAQTIKQDAQFEGFEQLLQRYTGQLEVKLDALRVGHRSARPIVELALRASGREDPALIEAAREGEPVEWLEDEAAAIAALSTFREARPNSIVAVLCRRKPTADDWARKLTAAGLGGVRRAARQDFEFTPGVVVSNVHQVKGLEFDGVLVVEPGEYAVAERELLHVAITRAAERLWLVASRGRGLLR